MPVHSQAHRDLTSGIQPDTGDQEHGAHADDLLSHLGKCRHSGFLHSVIITVNAGVEGCKGNRYGHNRKIGRASGFQQKLFSQEMVVGVNDPGKNKRHAHGNHKACLEHGLAPGLVGGHILGQGGLDGTCTDGKTDAEYGMDHIVNAQALGSDGPGHVNTVEKAQDPAYEPCGGKEQRTCYKRHFPWGKAFGNG